MAYLQAEITPQELLIQELEQFNSGPLNILTNSVLNNSLVVVNCRNNKKLIGYIKGFDRHCNLLMKEVRELWTEKPRTGRGQPKGRAIMKDRFIKNMFLRGDSVIFISRDYLEPHIGGK